MTLRAGRVVDILLALFCLAMLALMWIMEGDETIPYHFLFLAVAIVYGFRVWPMTPTVVVVTVVTVATGLVFTRSAFDDAVDITELSEVLLMPLLLMAMVWHARRREAAMRTVERISGVNEQLLEREHEFLRETSHAIRTPVTIARAYVDIAREETSEADMVEHLNVVSRQLDRTETLSRRLLSLAALDSDGLAHFDMIDLTDVARSASADWSGGEQRYWIEDFGSPIWILGDVTGIQAALDAMVENAMHFTEDGATIRVSCRKLDGCALLEVADSGPGIDEQDLPHVFDRFWHRTPPDGVVGSGLGLAMVCAVAEAHGGQAMAGVAPEGGAMISMTFPRPTITDSAAIHPESLPAASPGPTREASTPAPTHEPAPRPTTAQE